MPWTRVRSNRTIPAPSLPDGSASVRSRRPGECRGGRLGEHVAGDRGRAAGTPAAPKKVANTVLPISCRRAVALRHVFGPRHERRNEDHEHAVDRSGRPAAAACARRNPPAGGREHVDRDCRRSPPRAGSDAAAAARGRRAAAPRDRSLRTRPPPGSPDRRHWSGSRRGARRQRLMRQQRGHVEQLLERVGPDHAGLAEQRSTTRSLVGQRAGVRRGGPRAGRGPARPSPRRSACCGRPAARSRRTCADCRSSRGTAG